jgi:hypothetical protein
MIKLTIIIGTRRGYRKVFLRGFSSNKALQVNADDGRNIDRSSDIADEYRGDKTGLDTYFRDKELSIQRDFDRDSESGAADGVSASELEDWKIAKDDMLEQLDQQKDDVIDLTTFAASVSDSDSDSNSDNSGDNINGNNNNSVNGTSGGNPVESNSNDRVYHPQDSSDVVQTDFPSFDPFDE